jgi:hypothetical protein
MEQQPSGLDPYDLLEIAPELRPPTHYQLLGIDDFETDLELIQTAAKQRGAYLHQIAAGPQRKVVQQLLGEVAVARRTLLVAESKQQYDQELMALLEDEPGEAFASPFQIATDTGAESGDDAATEEQPASRSRRRQKSKWDEYKLHLLSASILLLIVGIVWFVNRGSGERVASQAPASTSNASPAVSTPARPRKSSSASLPAAPRPGSQAPSPPRKRSTPSLAPTFDLSAFQPPAMSQPGTANKEPKANAASQPTAQPIAAATTADYSSAVMPVALELSADWQPDIKLVDEFKAKLGDRYVIDKNKHALTIQDQRAVITAGSGKRINGSLRHKSLKLTPKMAVALDTNLAPGESSPGQVGFAIGPLRIALTAGAKGVQVRAKNQSDDGPMKTLGQLKTIGPQTTLIVWRSAGDPNRVDWLAISDQSTLSGRIAIGKLGRPPVTIVYLSPEKAFPQPVWFDNLRVGEFVNVPELPPSELLQL